MGCQRRLPNQSRKRNWLSDRSIQIQDGKMVNTSDLSAVNSAISKAQEHLLDLQSPEGFWVGELVVDSTLCSDYIAFMHWAGEVDVELERKCIDHILDRKSTRLNSSHA